MGRRPVTPQKADGSNDGAGRFRAERVGHESGGDGAGWAAGRTAGPSRDIPWIEARPGERRAGHPVTAASGEFHHGELADQQATDVIQF